MRGRGATVSSSAARFLVALLAVLVTAVLVTACAKPPGSKAELRAVVLPAAPGARVTEMEIRTAAGVVDLALGEIGIARREVVPMADGRIRIVLPESLAGRMPDVRKRLEDPKLHVRVE